MDSSTPRIFSLQKIVEVADFNMHSRSRLDWANIWCVRNQSTIHTYIYTYIHSYIHTFIHTASLLRHPDMFLFMSQLTHSLYNTSYNTYTHIHTYFHSFIHTHTHTYIHISLADEGSVSFVQNSYILTYIHTYIHKESAGIALHYCGIARESSPGHVRNRLAETVINQGK